MKLKELAEASGKTVPFVMNLQQKFALPACKEYSAAFRRAEVEQQKSGFRVGCLIS